MKAMEEKEKISFDVNKLIQELNVKWQNRPCPMCGNKNFTISDKVYELREFQGGNIVLGSGSINPIIPVICTNCGNSIMINALVAGAISKSKEAEKGGNDESQQ